MNTDIFDNKIFENINNLIVNNRLPHAIMFVGGNEENRRKLADSISAAVVCTGSKKPCGSCVDCKKTFNHLHPDVINIDPVNEDKETMIKVSVIREIRQDAFILPNEASGKVYIIHCAEKMNEQAQNALLKIIEEPPDYAKFILLCDSSASLLDTIISRVTAFNLGAADTVKTDEEDRIYKISSDIAGALVSPTELELLRLTALFEKDKELMQKVLPYLLIIFRDAMILKSGSDKTDGLFIDESRVLASKVSMKSILELIEDINILNEAINRNSNKSLLCTRFSSLLRSTAFKR